MKNSNKKGFTLVELVVVIAIIGVLAAILVPSMMGYVKKSRLKTANGNAKTAYNAIAEYLAEEETKGTLGDVDNDSCVSAATSALAANGGDAGVVATNADAVKTAADTTWYAQWRKNGSDEIKGQYPDAPATVAASEGMTFGQFGNPNT